MKIDNAPRHSIEIIASTNHDSYTESTDMAITSDEYDNQYYDQSWTETDANANQHTPDDQPVALEMFNLYDRDWYVYDTAEGYRYYWCQFYQAIDNDDYSVENSSELGIVDHSQWEDPRYYGIIEQALLGESLIDENYDSNVEYINVDIYYP